jgi:hypothetical protein
MGRFAYSAFSLINATIREIKITDTAVKDTTIKKNPLFLFKKFFIYHSPPSAGIW